MLPTRKTTLAALLLSTTMAAGALAASPSPAGCQPGVQKTEGEGGTSFTSAGVKKTEGEGGTSFTSAGVKKTEGEGGSTRLSQQAMATPCQ